MSGMKILISPLRWGFGHAGRMIPLARELQARGCEVIFGADAQLIPLIEHELPGIRMIEVPGLHIRYSAVLPQYVCIFLQTPGLIFSSVREHYLLKRLAREIKPSVIISDNRFGFWHRKIFSVYVTHQLRIPFPRLLRFLEPVGVWIHRKIISRFDLCLVPDYPGSVNLSGRLSHDLKLPDNTHYTGPLSRFRVPASSESLSGYGQHSAMESPSGFIEPPAMESPSGFIEPPAMESPSGFIEPPAMELPPGYGEPFATHAKTAPGPPLCTLILSGPEPQRSLLLRKVRGALCGTRLYVLSATPVQAAVGNDPGITFIIKPDTNTMRDLVAHSTMVITRSGYTSVMELVSLGRGAVLIPTPGQTEQEYLGEYLNGHHGFMTVMQSDTGKLGRLVEAWVVDSRPPLPDSTLLFAEAVDLILENKKARKQL